MGKNKGKRNRGGGRNTSKNETNDSLDFGTNRGNINTRNQPTNNANPNQFGAGKSHGGFSTGAFGAAGGLDVDDSLNQSEIVVPVNNPGHGDAGYDVVDRLGYAEPKPRSRQISVSSHKSQIHGSKSNIFDYAANDYGHQGDEIEIQSSDFRGKESFGGSQQILARSRANSGYLNEPSNNIFSSRGNLLPQNEPINVRSRAASHVSDRAGLEDVDYRTSYAAPQNLHKSETNINRDEHFLNPTNRSNSVYSHKSAFDVDQRGQVVDIPVNRNRSVSVASRKSGFGQGEEVHIPITKRNSVSIASRTSGYGHHEPDFPQNEVEIPVTRERTMSIASNGGGDVGQGREVEIPITRGRSYSVAPGKTDRQNENEGEAVEIPINRQRSLSVAARTSGSDRPTELLQIPVKPKPRSRTVSFNDQQAEAEAKAELDAAFGPAGSHLSINHSRHSLHPHTLKRATSSVIPGDPEPFRRTSAANSVVSHKSGFENGDFFERRNAPSRNRLDSVSSAQNNRETLDDFGLGDAANERILASSRTNSVLSDMIPARGDDFMVPRIPRSRHASTNSHREMHEHDSRDVGTAGDNSVRAIHEDPYSQHRLSRLSIHTNNDEFVLVGGHPPGQDSASNSMHSTCRTDDFNEGHDGTWRSSGARTSMQNLKSTSTDQLLTRSGSSIRSEIHASRDDVFEDDDVLHNHEIVIPNQPTLDRPPVPRILLNDQEMGESRRSSQDVSEKTSTYRGSQRNLARDAFGSSSTNTSSHQPNYSSNTETRKTSFGSESNIPYTRDSYTSSKRDLSSLSARDLYLRSRATSRASMASTNTEDHLRQAYEYSKRLEDQMPVISSREPSLLDCQTSRTLIGSRDDVNRAASVERSTGNQQKNKPMSRSASISSNVGNPVDRVVFSEIPTLYSHPDDRFDDDAEGEPFRPTSEHLRTPMNAKIAPNRPRILEHQTSINIPSVNSNIYANATEMTVPISLSSRSTSAANSINRRSRQPSFNEAPVRPLIVTSALTPLAQKKSKSVTQSDQNLFTPQTVAREPRCVKKFFQPLTSDIAVQTGGSIRLRQAAAIEQHNPDSANPENLSNNKEEERNLDNSFTMKGTSRPLMNNSFERTGHPAASVLNSFLQGRLDKDREADVSCGGPHSSQSNSSHQVTIVQQSSSTNTLYREKFEATERFRDNVKEEENFMECKWSNSARPEHENPYTLQKAQPPKSFEENSNVFKKSGANLPNAQQVLPMDTHHHDLRAAILSEARSPKASKATTPSMNTTKNSFNFTTPIRPSPSDRAPPKPWRDRMAAGSTASSTPVDRMAVEIPLNANKSVLTNEQTESPYKSDRKTSASTDHSSNTGSRVMIDARWTDPKRFGDTIRKHVPRGRIKDLATAFDNIQSPGKTAEQSMGRTSRDTTQVPWKSSAQDFSRPQEPQNLRTQEAFVHESEKSTAEEDSMIDHYKRALAEHEERKKRERERDNLRQMQNRGDFAGRQDYLAKTPEKKFEHERGSDFYRHSFDRVSTASSRPESLHRTSTPVHELHKPPVMESAFGRIPSIRETTSQQPTSYYRPQYNEYKPKPMSPTKPNFAVSKTSTSSKPGAGVVRSLTQNYERHYGDQSPAGSRHKRSRSAAPAEYRDAVPTYGHYEQNPNEAQHDYESQPPQQHAARFSRHDALRSHIPTSKNRSSSAHPRNFNTSRPLQASPDMNRNYEHSKEKTGKFESPNNDEKYSYGLRTEEESSIRGKIDRMFDFVQDESPTSHQQLSSMESNRSRFEKFGQNVPANRFAGYVPVEKQRYYDQKGEWDRILRSEDPYLRDVDSFDFKFDKTSEMDDMSERTSTMRHHGSPPGSSLAYSLSGYREMQRAFRDKDRTRDGLHNDQKSQHEHLEQSPQHQEPQFFRSQTMAAPHAGQSMAAYRTRYLLGTPAAVEKVTLDKRVPTALATSTPLDSPSSRLNAADNFSAGKSDYNDNDTFMSSISAASVAELQMDYRRKIEKITHMVKTTDKQIELNELALADALSKGRSMQALSAHRSLLLSRELSRVQRDELRRLHALSAIRRPPPPLSFNVKSSVVVSNIVVQLNKNFCQRQHDNGSYAFVVLLKCGHEVDATEVAPLLVNQKTQVDQLFFGKQIRFADLPVDYMIKLEVYAMRLPEVKVEQPSNSFTSKCKTLIGPPQRKIDPQSLETGFRLRGRMSLDRDAAGDRCFYLDDVAYPLEGTVKIRTQCSSLPDAIEVDYRGFLSVYQTVSGMASWDRYWAVLRRGVVFFWKYPDDEQLDKHPLMQIDLTKCTNHAIDKMRDGRLPEAPFVCHRNPRRLGFVGYGEETCPFVGRFARLAQRLALCH
ncbi:unnamed protein product [Caenorhabditis auriculariae]|uniref:Anillin homology domain-containing protein n=1 Tax=Caenorhabditis auriculariae TaxID=2777116 RepID=A0A8S1HJM8_9PELO|nr:unnamed protein product [Caenorhabditis auriculariae]